MTKIDELKERVRVTRNAFYAARREAEDAEEKRDAAEAEYDAAAAEAELEEYRKKQQGGIEWAQ